MSGRYTLSVKCSFSASHALPECPPCDRLHGHTWRVRAEWVFTDLDEKGMGADFSALRKLLHSIVRERFDHQHLNDVEPFKEMAPTAENLAREFFRLLAKETPAGAGGRLCKVEVWEGPENFVAYEE